MSRSFTIDAVLRGGKRFRLSGGRFMSETPSAAARKMFTSVYNQKIKQGQATLEIHVRETTQNSDKKIFKYKVSRVANSTEVNIRGKTIIYQYSTKVKAI